MGLLLFRSDGWIKDTTVQFMLTMRAKDGDVFSYSQPPTVLRQAVQKLILANASVLFKVTVLPIAELQIQKME